MNNYTFFLLGVIPLLLALVIGRSLIKKKLSLLGYFIGLIPFAAAWLLFMLQLPSAESCSQTPLACEWTGIGAFFFTVYLVSMVIVYSCLSISMMAYYRRVSSGSKMAESPGIRNSIALKTIICLAMMSILGGLMGLTVLAFIDRGIFVNWQNLGNPPEPGLAQRIAGERSTHIRSYNLNEIQVETNQGRIFQTDIDGCLKDRLPRHQNCWYFGRQEELANVGFVVCGSQFWIRNPPPGVVEQVNSRTCTPFQIQETSYVLMGDGTVWTWHNIARTDSYNKTFAALLGSLFGLVLGSIIIWLYSKRYTP